MCLEDRAPGTWRAVVNKSPIPGVMGPFPNGRFMGVEPKIGVGPQNGR